MKKNIWIFAGVLVAVLVVGALLIRKPKVSPTTLEVPAPGEENVQEKVVVDKEDTESVRQIEVSGDEYSYTPDSILVKKGEKIKIVFTNNGNLPHNLVIDDLNVSTKTIAGGKTDTILFTAEADATIVFYCSIGNHRAQGMEGTIKLE